MKQEVVKRVESRRRGKEREAHLSPKVFPFDCSPEEKFCKERKRKSEKNVFQPLPLQEER